MNSRFIAYGLGWQSLPLILLTILVTLFLTACSDDAANSVVTTPDVAVTDTGGLDAGSTDIGAPDMGEPDVQGDPVCTDGLQNGQETDVDCGGPDCPSCPTGSTCEDADDCASGICDGGVCRLPTCDEAACGEGEACFQGQCYGACEDSDDCDESSRCYEGICAPFDCDGILCEAGESCLRGICYPPCGGEAGQEPCPALDFTTDAARTITADSASLRGTLIELPREGVTDHGFCWFDSPEPSLNQGQCESLGEGQPGIFRHEVAELHAGRVYYVRAYAVAEEDTFYANEVEFTTLAPAPTGVTASQGTSAAHVEVTWLPNSAATGYRVYRDGLEVASFGESTLRYEDTGAEPGSEPGAPAGAGATAGTHPDRVVISWNAAATSDDANRHSYTVVAEYPNAASPPSGPATGYRGAGEVTSYELQIEGGAWFDVGLDTSYEDTGAPEGTIEAGTATATAGEHSDRVALAASGASASPGAAVEYRVRAITATGNGTPTEILTGNRGVGALQYQWQRSAGDNDGAYDDLGGATSPSHDDASAPVDGSGRYYRARISAEGASSSNTPAVRGFRAVASIVSTDSVSAIAATTATFHGTIGTLGVPAATVHGFCWSGQTNPSTEPQSGANCESLGAPSNTGAFSFAASGLTPGSTYYVRAYSTNNAGTAYGDNISFVTPPAAPTGVAASDGTSPNYVRVTWNAAAGADEYRVFRDGVLVGTVVATSYDDTGAGTGGLPLAPQVSATSGDHTDRVALNWNEPAAAPGSTHTYTVVAVKNDVAGQPSGADTGYRSAHAVSVYELQIDGGQWADLGLTLVHDDTDAPEGSLSAGTASASDGEFAAHVALSLTGQGATPGASRSYRVRAMSAAGTGAASDAAEGHRGVGPVSIQWQRSAADSDANYSNLVGATAASFNDSGAPADGSGRYYQASVSADGTSPLLSNPVRGFRAALPDVVTNAPQLQGAMVTLHGDIVSLGAPNPSAHGFCWGSAPNPDLQEAGDTICHDLGGTASTGTFSHVATEITALTTYYVRAYATTNAGTVYGDNETFEVVWTEVPVLYFNFESGNSVVENLAPSGTALRGEFLGNVAYANEGRFGNRSIRSPAGSGAGDRLDIEGQINLLDMAQGYTAMAWVKVLGGSGGQGILILGSCCSPREGYTLNYEGSNFRFWGGSSSNDSNYNAYGGSTQLNQWVHVGIRVNQSNVEFMFNGVVASSTSSNLPTAPSLANDDGGSHGPGVPHIGGQGISGRTGSDILIDEVRVYDQYLDDEAYQRAMNANP